MHSSIPNFDRGKPFYPFIMAYFASLHGYLDLIARNIVDRNIQDDDVSDLPPELGVLIQPMLARFMNASKTPSIIEDKMTLASDVGLGVDVVWGELESDLLSNSAYLTGRTVDTASRMLILGCFEITKDQFVSTDATWQFFRHCRNAAAHNGKFHFLDRNGNVVPIRSNEQPEWCGKSIYTSMQGQTLLTDGATDAFLKPGDIIRLLYDIEQLI